MRPPYFGRRYAVKLIVFDEIEVARSLVGDIGSAGALRGWRLVLATARPLLLHWRRPRPEEAEDLEWQQNP